MLNLLQLTLPLTLLNSWAYTWQPSHSAEKSKCTLVTRISTEIKIKITSLQTGTHNVLNNALFQKTELGKFCKLALPIQSRQFFSD